MSDDGRGPSTEMLKQTVQALDTGAKVKKKKRPPQTRGVAVAGGYRTQDGTEYVQLETGVHRHRFRKVNGKVSKRARNRARKAERLALGMTRKEHRAFKGQND